MKKNNKEKGFVLSTEATIGVIAVIIIITTITFIVENPGAQPDSKIWKNTLEIIKAQTTTINDKHLGLQYGMENCGSVGDYSCYSGDYYCYRLYHLDIGPAASFEIQENCGDYS